MTKPNRVVDCCDSILGKKRLHQISPSYSFAQKILCHEDSQDIICITNLQPLKWCRALGRSLGVEDCWLKSCYEGMCNFVIFVVLIILIRFCYSNLVCSPEVKLLSHYKPNDHCQV
jgi:hypothetical protein